MKKIGLLLIISMALFGCKPDALDKPLSEEQILRINELSGQIINNVLEEALLQGLSLDTLVLFNQLKEIDEVKSVRFNLAGTGISVQLKDGSENHFFLVAGNDGRWFAPSGGNSPVPEKKPDTKASDPNYIVPMGDKRALLLAPFEFQTTGAGNSVDYASVFNTLTDAGFQVDSFMNKNANLQRFKGEYLSQFDVVLMHTHGGVLHNKKTNEDYTVLVTGTLYEGNYAALSKEEKARVERVTIGTTPYLAVTPSWFEHTTQTEFDNAWVFVTGCQTTLVDDLYKTLFALGVEGYNGFNVAVSFSSADAFMNRMVSHFTSALSFDQASSQTAGSTPIEQYSAQWQAVFGHLQTAVTEKRFDAEQKTENTPFYLILPAGYDKKPRVVTKSISEKSNNHAATVSEVVFEGAAKVTARGVCWSTSENPTKEDFKTTDGKGLGEFYSYLGGLTYGTTYYVRAYATNAEGTAYGNQISFETDYLSGYLPSVKTGEIAEVTKTTAVCADSEVEHDGNREVTARGICWREEDTPNIEDDPYTTDGTGVGKFSSTLTGLSPGTVYKVRAYAINSEGIKYGKTVSFGTEAKHTVPLVYTGGISHITKTTAICNNSNVATDGYLDITARGVCWSTSENPTINDFRTTDGNGLGTFTSTLTGLSPGTVYYVRAYAINAEGVGYGENQETFSTIPEDGIEYGYFTDPRDGKKYKTVTIGANEWFAENLSYLPAVVDGKTGSTTDPYCYVYKHENTSVEEAKNKMDYKNFGVLYNWQAAMLYCPEGWHLPSDAEWQQLELLLGMPKEDLENPDGPRGTNEGTKMKEEGMYYWNFAGGTNESGFSGRGGGFRDVSGNFRDKFQYGIWWSSTKTDYIEYRVILRQLSSTSETVIRGRNDEDWGFSVRCVKN
ncbi:MAG: FISUMP domain-containing protein [Bacteroidales bacterium]